MIERGEKKVRGEKKGSSCPSPIMKCAKEIRDPK